MVRRYALLAVCLLALGSGRAAVAEFDVVTFGDSLTNNDFLGLFYGNPQDLYGDDPTEAVFEKAAFPDDRLASYAIAGSESGDAGLQIDVYEFFRLIGVQDKADFIGYEIGGNDVLNHIGLLSEYAPGESPSADAIIDNLIGNIEDDLARLHSSHPKARALVWTVPDVTVTPKHWYALSPVQVANVHAHIERANLFIHSLAASPSVAVLDLYALSRWAVSNPPVILGHQLMPPPDYGDYGDLFADDIHPTAVANALIANAIVDVVNGKWGYEIPRYTEEELADLAHIPH